MTCCSPPRFFSRRILPAVLCILTLAAPLFAQQGLPDPYFASVPFARWNRAGQHKEIPWSVEILPLRLSVHQRLMAPVRIMIPGREILRRLSTGSLAIFLQITDQQGRVYQDHTLLESKYLERETKKGEAQLRWDLLLVPGSYIAAFALYDTQTKEYSYLQRGFRVAPLEKDPLPTAWSGLPSVEFLIAKQDLDDQFQPKLEGRLHLPLVTERPLRIEVLMNLTPSDRFAASRSIYTVNLGNLLPTLKTLSQIDVRNGSVDVATLDLTRRRVGFEQRNVRDLDWPKLREALAAADPNSVDVRDLQGRALTAAFLRGEIERRLAPSSPPPGQRPLRALFFVSSPMALNTKLDPEPVTPPPACDCVVYYIQYNVLPTGLQIGLRRRGVLPDAGPDNFLKLLKPLNPRTFSVETPEDFRAALAQILAELSRN